jgi:hypothetical protein
VYKAAHGNCNVPSAWAADPILASWVKHQRTCKKALDRGKPGYGMTAARVAKLDALGFSWDTRRDIDWANLDEAGGAILRCQSLPAARISD